MESMPCVLSQNVERFFVLVNYLHQNDALSRDAHQL
jgi:hypothetical protein